jgi:hypothetical protein
MNLKIPTRLIAAGLLACSLATLAPAVSFEDESMAVVFEKYSIDHQGLQVIDLVATLHFTKGIADKDYPEVVGFYKLTDKLMKEYPNETDWWEIWNKRVAASLLEAYPMAERVEILVSMHPTFDIPYPNKYRCVARR